MTHSRSAMIAPLPLEDPHPLRAAHRVRREPRWQPLAQISNGALPQHVRRWLLDDGSLTGAPVPAVSEIEDLITAAVGLDAGRGDSLSVSTIAYPVPEVAEEPALLTLDEVVGVFKEGAQGLHRLAGQTIRKGDAQRAIADADLAGVRRRR
mgnify:CR=1 FL=1